MIVPLKVSIEDIVENISYDEAEKLILAIDLAMADYGFTETIVKHLVATLIKECEGSEEPFNINDVLPK